MFLRVFQHIWPSTTDSLRCSNFSVVWIRKQGGMACHTLSGKVDKLLALPNLLRNREPFAINHMRGMCEAGAGTKANLCRALRAGRHKPMPRQPGVLPCFVLPDDSTACEAFRNQGTRPDLIYKPDVSTSAKGVEINAPHVCQRSSGVVQPLVSPLLVDGRKVDLRLYVLVRRKAHGAPIIHLHRNGQAKVAPVTYNKSILHSALTNRAPTAQLAEKMRHDRLLIQQLARQTSLPWEQIVWPRIRAAVAAVVTKVMDRAWKIAPCTQNRSADPAQDCTRAFMLLGVDVILNEHGQPYVMEVNPDPSMLTLASALDHSEAARIHMFDSVYQGIAKLVGFDAGLRGRAGGSTHDWELLNNVLD